MPITFMTTADEQTTARWTSVGGGTIVSNTYARTGTYSFRVSGLQQLHKTVASSATLPYVRICVLHSSATANVNIQFREGTTIHISVYLDFAAGSIAVRRNTTALGTYSIGLTPGVWYCLEISGTVHNSTGTTNVELNGVAIAALTLTGQDTQNGGTGVCDNVYITCSEAYTYIDDVMFRDDQLPGTGGIVLSTVNAEATSGQKEWTASTSTPNSCVDEIPASFTDYIYENNDVYDRHEFEHTAIADVTYANISGYAVIGLAKMHAAGSGKVKMVFDDPGVAEDVGSAVNLDTSGVYAELYQTVDPSDAALTRTVINRSYIGVEVSA